MTENTINDGRHRSSARDELTLIEGAKTMPSNMLIKLFSDSLDRALANRTMATGHRGSLKVALLIGRELQRRGYDQPEFINYLALIEAAVEGK